MSEKIKLITLEEAKKKYPKEKDRQTKVMSYGELGGKQMYLDYGSVELKEEMKRLDDKCFFIYQDLINMNNQILNQNEIIPIDNIPSQYDFMFREAINLKRDGDYYSSLSLYQKILNACGLSAELVNGIYKTMVAAGWLAFAFEIMHIALISALQNSNSHYVQQYQSHLDELVLGANDEKKLFNYMQAVSGNPDYDNPFPYEYLKQQMVDVVKKYQR